MKEIIFNEREKEKTNLLLTSYKNTVMRYMLLMKNILKQQSIS